MVLVLSDREAFLFENVILIVPMYFLTSTAILALDKYVHFSTWAILFDYLSDKMSLLYFLQGS